MLRRSLDLWRSRKHKPTKNNFLVPFSVSRAISLEQCSSFSPFNVLLSQLLSFKDQLKKENCGKDLSRMLPNPKVVSHLKRFENSSFELQCFDKVVTNPKAKGKCHKALPHSVFIINLMLGTFCRYLQSPTRHSVWL